MKQRKELRPGDMVKFVGYTKEIEGRYHFADSVEWHEVITHNKDETLILNIFGKKSMIHRRQVTNVKRKKKYIDRDSLAKAIDETIGLNKHPFLMSRLVEIFRQKGFEGF